MNAAPPVVPTPDSPRIVDVRFENRADSVGIGVRHPRISWRTETTIPDWRQVACEVEIERGGQVASTGRLETSESVLVDWPFAPLASRERVSIRVRCWGTDAEPPVWSAAAFVEAGLFEQEDWQARFITPDWDEDLSQPQPSPMLRKEFALNGQVRQARLYITSLGLYTVELNGERASDHLFAPGWTSYHHRLCYQTLDVTASLREGPNAIGVVLGDGWYRGRLGYHGGRRNIYGDKLALLAQLEVEFMDGSSTRMITDQSWHAATGAILASDLYDGEQYDARLEQDGWSKADFDDSAWSGVRLLDYDLSTLDVSSSPPVRRTAEISPVAVITSRSGRTILDFGQNLVGRLRLTVRGACGATVTLRHAEVLEEGELCTRPLRFAAATDQYTLKGDGIETWEPEFTFHGFRYAEVDGWPGTVDPEAVRAIVCHSDMERIGWFECSEPLVNRLHENVVWSMRGNFLSIPTDCPQRDERLGWTGDIQVFAPSAAFLFDVSGFLQSWLADLALEQKAANGIVPFFVPDIMGTAIAPAAAWGDAAVIVPWFLYHRYGDRGILEAQYESMRTWVDALIDTAGATRIWDQGIQFGDWLDPKAPPDDPGGARTAPYVVATAYFAHSAGLLAEIAAILQRGEDAAHYTGVADEVRAAFADTFVTPAGRIVSDATTAYALALEFALLPSKQLRSAAAKRLTELVRGSGYHISTGFVGTPLVCDALCRAGDVDAAYRLLLQTSCPSWLYPVTMGATTIWERWDSMLPDGSINPGEMTSFNHYALGAVADWLHRSVAGIAPASAGYRDLTIRPQPGRGIKWAWARHKTPYGMASCRWRIKDESITVSVEVPPNTVANVYLPGCEDDAPLCRGTGIHHWTLPWVNDPEPAPIITLDSTFGELLDHPAFRPVMAAIAKHNAEFANRMEGNLAVPLRQMLLQNPNSDRLITSVDAILRMHNPIQ